jgi:hypothetical protein
MNSNNYQDNVFFVNYLKESDFLSFSVFPNYKPFTSSDIIAFQSCYQQTVLKINDIDELCSAIACSLSLSSLRVKKKLFDSGLIRLNTLMRYELVSPLIDKEKDQNLRNKSLSPEHKNRINTLRGNISYIYDTHSKDNPSITYSSDGTGTGKSYSVIDKFIQQTDVNNIEQGHRNLLFLTPQKSQIDINPDLIKDAESKGIKILGFLSQDDMSNIEFKNWVTGEVSKDIFERWIKELDNDNWLKNYIYKLEKTVRDAEFYNTEIPKAKKRGELDTVEEYEERQKKNKYKLREMLESLAGAILQQKRANGEYIPIKERFDKTEIKKNGKHNKDGLLSEIIDFVLPFERAKLSPCILLATSDKFDYNVNIAVDNKKDEKPVIQSLAFDYIIGQKKKALPDFAG